MESNKTTIVTDTKVIVIEKDKHGTEWVLEIEEENVNATKHKPLFVDNLDKIPLGKYDIKPKSLKDDELMEEKSRFNCYLRVMLSDILMLSNYYITKHLILAISIFVILICCIISVL